METTDKQQQQKNKQQQQQRNLKIKASSLQNCGIVVKGAYVALLSKSQKNTPNTPSLACTVDFAQ